MTVDVVDVAHWRHAQHAGGLLRTFNDAGVIEAADVLVARRLTAMAGESDDRVALAVAFVVRAVRGGSVCVALPALQDQIAKPDLPWPGAQEWLGAVAASPLLGSPPVLHLERDLLYLDRYWLEERQVAQDVLGLVAVRPVGAVPAIDRLFPAGYEEQRRAAEIALSQGLTVLTGGPGTGKTTTVARLLALLAEQAELTRAPRLRVALAAPTGKAAARLQEAVQLQVDGLESVDRERLQGLRATTLHRLLGSRPDTSSRFRHHRGNRLPHDLIVVDETSMVSLTMMARLVEAVRPESRLMLVGDPDQLASVEAGAVLADLVEGLGSREDTPIATLVTSHRFGVSIGRLASAVRLGEADRAFEVLAAGGEHIEWIDTDRPMDHLRRIVVPHALRLREAAILGDAHAALATLEEHRLLCAHRHGPYGATHWNRQIERWLTEATDMPLWASWYVGRPFLFTANDYGLGVYNGDIGVTVLRGGALRAVVSGAEGALGLATSRLADVETMHAMTIHKSQGSQVAEITVLLPPADSRLLTRELLYTAITRARTKVRVIGSAEQLQAALAHRAVRASGLSRRLRDESV